MPGTRKLGKTTDQRRAMLRQQVTDFLDRGKMETTVTRCKEIRPLAEKMITLEVGRPGCLPAGHGLCDPGGRGQEDLQGDCAQLRGAQWRLYPHHPHRHPPGRCRRDRYDRAGLRETRKKALSCVGVLHIRKGFCRPGRTANARLYCDGQPRFLPGNERFFAVLGCRGRTDNVRSSTNRRRQAS